MESFQWKDRRVNASADAYHHGSLRRSILDRLEQVIAERGAAGVTIRGLATDVGVSHTAVGHHFGTRTGLLSAFAAEGFDLLSEALLRVRDEGEFLDLGIAYLRFALEHPAHFSVMFEPKLLDYDAHGLREASRRAFSLLQSSSDDFGGDGERESTAAILVAGWGMMHGIAQLALAGVFDEGTLREAMGNADVIDLARRAGRLLEPPTAG